MNGNFSAVMEPQLVHVQHSEEISSTFRRIDPGEGLGFL